MSICLAERAILRDSWETGKCVQSRKATSPESVLRLLIVDLHYRLAYMEHVWTTVSHDDESTYNLTRETARSGSLGDGVWWSEAHASSWLRNWDCSLCIETSAQATTASLARGFQESMVLGSR